MLVTGSGVVIYGTYQYQTDEGSRRAVQAYTTFVPVILRYRFLQAKQRWLVRRQALAGTDVGDEWRALDELYAKPTVEKLGDLQGMYTKYGQTAAGFTNTLGDAWIQELRKLEDQVPPRSVSVVKETIQQETNGQLDDIFLDIDPVPLGSASIGQVHRAILRHNHQEVAVKVQYPEAQALFRRDMETIRSLCQWFAPEQIVMLNALEKQNAQELDYRTEAHNLERIKHNMRNKHRFEPREVVVPAPIRQLTTSRMLVMELLPGVKLMDGIRAYYHEWALKNGTTLWDLEQEARHRIETEGIPAKYTGPSAWQMGLYRHYLRLQDGLVNLGIALYNGTIANQESSIPYQHTMLPPNTPRIVDTLMRVHGYQLLADGFFNAGKCNETHDYADPCLVYYVPSLKNQQNPRIIVLHFADPHGGNFILLPDGRIGLIDFGATKKLTRNERLSACLLYAALARNDSRMLFDMCDVGGYKSKYGNKQVVMKLIRFGYDSWGKDVMEGKNIQQFIDQLKQEDPWTEVPDNLVMAQVSRHFVQWCEGGWLPLMH
jgi:aarF domain-containing kinase